MKDDLQNMPEFYDLLDKVWEDTLSDAQAARFEELLKSDPRARRLYLSAINLHGMLAWDIGMQRNPVEQPDGNFSETLVKPIEEVLPSELPQALDMPISAVSTTPTSSGTAPVAPASPLGFLGSAWQGTMAHFDFDKHPARFSYLVASILFVIVGFMASHIYVTTHSAQNVAENNSNQTLPDSSKELPSAINKELPPTPVVVGRIVNTADCKFGVQGAGAETIKSAIKNQKSLVVLGDKLLLASGLMEIAYDTGARVILEGPCTYTIESTSGGFLTVGKLTAKLEKNGKHTDLTSRSPSLPVSKSPSLSFFVRTPTAIVTDLGTEFGVDVSQAGVTETHVFRGKVRLEGSGKIKLQERILLAGQTMRVAPGIAVAATDVPKSDQIHFIREMPAAERARPLDLIGQIDYSDAWTANTSARPGSYLLLKTPESLKLEDCHGNPSRSWVFSAESAMATTPSKNSPAPWQKGLEHGFMECKTDCCLGFEYGLRDDFVVQFDAVQPLEHINVTIGDRPATAGYKVSTSGSLPTEPGYDWQLFSVFFDVVGATHPEVSLFTPSQGAIDAEIHSDIPVPWRWHNYAVQFDLRAKRLTVWVDRQYRGVINLAAIRKKRGDGTWADLPWNNRYVTIGGYSGNGKGGVYIDNFSVGSPREIALPPAVERATSPLPKENDQQTLKNRKSQTLDRQ